jgi:hypothetical protein
MSVGVMNTGPIDALRRWSAEHRERLASAGMELDYVENANEEARSARVDLESEVMIGRATVWESGFCDLELLSVESGEQVMYQHHEEIDGVRLAALLDGLANQILKRA